MSATVLIAEDELLIAMDVIDELDAAGFRTVGPFAETASALEHCQSEPPDCAVLDVRLRDGESFPLADWLCARSVPVVFHSGHADGAQLTQRYPGALVCRKPAPSRTLAQMISDLCSTAYSAA